MGRRGSIIGIMVTMATLLLSATFIFIFLSQKDPTQCETLLDYRPTELLDKGQSRQEIENWVRTTYELQPNEVESFVSSTRNDIALIRWEKAGYDYQIAFSISEVRVQSIQISLPDGFFNTTISGEQLVQCVGEPESYRFSYVIGEISGGIYQIWYPQKGIMFQGVEPRQQTMNNSLDNNIVFNQYTFTRAQSNTTEMVLEILYGSSEEIIQSWITTIDPWEN